MNYSNLLHNEPTAPLGAVYLWQSDNESVIEPNSAGGHIRVSQEPLLRLDDPQKLSGRFVQVRNETVARKMVTENNEVDYRLGDAAPNPEGNFVFDPLTGGGRMDKKRFVKADYWWRYIEASRFGEVNTYYHTDKIAAFVDHLLQRLGRPSLPKLIVRVNAHNAIAENNGCCDGVLGKKSKKWLPFQGGHYRLPTKRRLRVVEHYPLSLNGEVHLGPGWRLTEDGALADFVKRKYRCNASHNAGTIYHEYGHHLTRHTADFRANNLKAPHCQCNAKTDLDEAYCDYLAATTMDSPHIWAFHHRHDQSSVHRRSLVSAKTMDDYDHTRKADPHENGTILAAALWNLRQSVVDFAQQGSNADRQDSIQQADQLVVYSLVLIGDLVNDPFNPDLKKTRRLRRGFGTALAALLEADRRLFSAQHASLIRAAFAGRNIELVENEAMRRCWAGANQSPLDPLDRNSLAAVKLRSKDTHAVIPESSELLDSAQLDQLLAANRSEPYSLVAVGDIMVGSRARNRTKQFGPDYIFAAVKPLFRRSAIVLGNQEGPIAKHAKKLQRNHSYKVSLQHTRVLRRAGINVVTLANNHLLDCGRDGVIESLKSLKKHNIKTIGAGTNRTTAHEPAIMQAGMFRVGLLGYYWNRRTSARRDKPGSALDTPERMAADLAMLRPLVDRIVVTHHWGVPYEREPCPEDREKAHLAIELGADIVIGHHPHIIQRVEIFNNCPIIYSIGNFAFGTGNSRAESLVVGVRFDSAQTTVDFFPAYVKNRDPRVNYQPKIITGEAARQSLERLAMISNTTADIVINKGIGQLVVPQGKQLSVESEAACVG